MRIKTFSLFNEDLNNRNKSLIDTYKQRLQRYFSKEYSGKFQSDISKVIDIWIKMNDDNLEKLKNLTDSDFKEQVLDEINYEIKNRLKNNDQFKNLITNKETFQLDSDEENEEEGYKSNLLRRFQIFLNNYITKRYSTTKNFDDLLNSIVAKITNNLYKGEYFNNKLGLLNKKLEDDIDSYNDDQLNFVDDKFEIMLDKIERERYLSQNKKNI